MPKENENAKPTHMGMEEILPIVDLLIDKANPSWGTIEHTSLIARVSIAAMEKANELFKGSATGSEDIRLFLCRTLDQHGIAGNASQFRQWLASDKGGNRIPKTAAVGKAQYK